MERGGSGAQETISMRIKDGTRRLLVGRLVVAGVALVSVALAGCASVAEAHGTVALTTSQARTATQSCPLPPVGLGRATYGAAPRGAAAHEVALTFDDGPSASSSPAILSFLERTHTPATFFVIGRQVRAAPGIVRREARDGFVVGVHTWDHPNLTKLSASRISQELTSTVGQLHSALGAGYCVRYFRPPYGAYNATVLGQARAAGLTAILWNVDPTDWARPGTQTIVNRVLKQVKAGSIILMHDGPSNRQQTAAALPAILAGLRARGLTPVTLPQLLSGAAGGASVHTSNRATSTASDKTATQPGTSGTKSGTTTATKSGTRMRTGYTPALQHRLYTAGKTTTQPASRCEHDGDHDADDLC
jgi:peptidoglycan/xylan/chitin deacetylase (PgdA/CDA1 family)